MSTPSIIIGIDPGNKGAVAVLDLRIENAKWEVADCPTIEMKVGKSIKNVPSAVLMSSLLCEYDDVDSVQVWIEKVSAMPSQGVTSMFTFGMNFGMWQGVTAALGFGVTLVTPQSWKKQMLAGMDDGKDASRMRALQLFPYLAQTLARKKDDGRAEAILIGEYGRRSLA